jgi:hypothetical protein
MENTPGFEGFAVLELMGHRKIAGYVREQNIAGAGFIRIDVPGKDGQVTASQFYSPGALYCLTPVAEDVARRFALGCQPEPVARWELPPAPARPRVAEGDQDEDPLEDEATALG